MLKSLHEQGENRKITAEETRKRTVTVCGKPVEFDFNKGKDPFENVMNEVVGMFETSQGMVLFDLTAPSEGFDEEAVVKMIESIRDPSEPESAQSDSMAAEPAGDSALSTEPESSTELDEAKDQNEAKPDEN
jgi:hypothetical protein